MARAGSDQLDKARTGIGGFECDFILAITPICVRCPGKLRESFSGRIRVGPVWPGATFCCRLESVPSGPKILSEPFLQCKRLLGLRSGGLGIQRKFGRHKFLAAAP